MQRCDQCGFVFNEVPIPTIPDAVRALGPRYSMALDAAERAAVTRRRPSPHVWSALEYACHVRDVLRVQRDRVDLALGEDRPEFTSMRREERVTEERYNDQEISTVIEELTQAAEQMASALDVLGDDQWARTGIYPWPEPAERSLTWVARQTVHEGLHHLEDIARGCDMLTGAQQGRSAAR